MPDSQARRIDFYFDYISHNAYLAWHLLPGIAEKYGYHVEPIPVLFAGFLKAYGQLGPAEVAPKLAWMNRNNLRKAASLGIPFSAPKLHPFNPLFLLRLSAQPMTHTERCAVTGCLLRGVWVDQLDPNDAEAVGSYLTSAGISADALVAGATSDEAKSQLKNNSDQALKSGAFGVPTMIVGDDVFWGFDDLPPLEEVLAGRDPLKNADVATFESEWVTARAQGQHRQK